MIANNQLKMYLRSLAEAFHAIYKDQRRPDFWGLREFYSTVREINALIKARVAAASEAMSGFVGDADAQSALEHLNQPEADPK